MEPKGEQRLKETVVKSATEATKKLTGVDGVVGPNGVYFKL